MILVNVISQSDGMFCCHDLDTMFYYIQDRCIHSKTALTTFSSLYFTYFQPQPSLLLAIRGLPFIFRDQRTNINHCKPLYYFSKYSPLRSLHFWMRSKHFCHSEALLYLQNMHSKHINRFFSCRKTLTSHFICPSLAYNNICPLDLYNSDLQITIILFTRNLSSHKLTE